MSSANQHRIPVAEARRQLRRRILTLRDQVGDSLDYALDHLFQDRVDEYFKVENKVDDIMRVLGVLAEEVEEGTDVASFRRMEGRLDVMEDQFEELDGEIRGRPRRRRRRLSLFDFFRKATGGQGRSEQSSGELRSTAEAYEILGVDPGTSEKTITATFRRRVRDLHPDVRGGDRSAEPLLRKLIAAYQCVKADLKGHPAVSE